jgi:hypothetical protein
MRQLINNLLEAMMVVVSDQVTPAVDLILETVVPQILDPQDLLEVVDLEDNS